MDPWKLVGRPYAFPSSPPESFDCWSLVKYVREDVGLSCPLPFDDGEPWCVPGALGQAVQRARGLWSISDTPTPYCMVVLEREHVGVFIDGGVLHAMARGATVVWTTWAMVRRMWPIAECWQA